MVTPKLALLVSMAGIIGLNSIWNGHPSSIHIICVLNTGHLTTLYNIIGFNTCT